TAPTALDNAGNSSLAVSCTYLVQYAIQGFLSPYPNTKWKAGTTAPVKIALADVNGTRIPDAGAGSMAAACRVKYGATGPPHTLTPQCMKYDAANHQFIYNWKLGS